MRPPPCAAMTSTTVESVTGRWNAAMKAASEASRMRRASACHETTPVRKRRGEPRTARPCFTRAAVTRPRARSRRQSAYMAARAATVATVEMTGCSTNSETS